MNEIWKDVYEYEGIYMVSNLGNVKSLNYNHTNIARNLRLCTDKNGYSQVQLMKNNKRKMVRVHRLVAQAFIQNAEKLPCVNHKDENKTNNRVENLEWCTVKYNNNYNEHQKKVSNSDKYKDTRIRNLNMTIGKRNKSGCKGVFFDNTKNKWVAVISIQHKTHNLGSFEYKENAIKVRKSAEEKYFKPIIEEYKKLRK